MVIHGGLYLFISSPLYAVNYIRLEHSKLAASSAVSFSVRIKCKNRLQE